MTCWCFNFHVFMGGWLSCHTVSVLRLARLMRLMRLVGQALDKFREADDKAGEAGVKSFRMRQVFQHDILQTKIAHWHWTTQITQITRQSQNLPGFESIPLAEPCRLWGCDLDCRDTLCRRQAWQGASTGVHLKTVSVVCNSKSCWRLSILNLEEWTGASTKGLYELIWVVRWQAEETVKEGIDLVCLATLVDYVTCLCLRHVSLSHCNI